MTDAYSIVVPTIGRPSLATLLESLSRAEGPLPSEVLVVDDRRLRTTELELGDLDDGFHALVRVLWGSAAGPAAARNRGLHHARSPWIAFLDDDVVVGPTWRRDLAGDIAACATDDAGTQGDLRVPLPTYRKATDWERNVAALEGARWITADCAYRRTALETVGGFDERFPRAFREDADLALRLRALGRTIVWGKRRAYHPVRPATFDVSAKLQAGNADDALMDALHGAEWRTIAQSPRGAFPEHVRTVACAFLALTFATIWFARTLHFAWRRIAPGPRDATEIGRMLATSTVIPFLAVGNYIRGRIGLKQKLQRHYRLPAAVLFDRDGTLVQDDPSLRDPQAIRPVAGAGVALERLRAAGIVLGVVSNAHRVGEGDLSADELHAVNARIEALLGPFATWNVCVHARDAGCACRKPQPALIEAAAAQIGVAPSACVVVGDIGSDVEAARAAGARALLVPTDVTRQEEIERAPAVANSLETAVDRILRGLV